MYTILAAVALSVSVYLWLVVDPAEMAVAAVDHRVAPPPPLRQRLVRWADANARRFPLYGERVQKELERVGQSHTRYLLWMVIGAAFGIEGLGVNMSLWLAPVGLVIGASIPRLLLARRYHAWVAAVVGDTGDLVTILKARLQAGETVVQAVRAAPAQLSGALGREWRRVAEQLDAGIDLATALRALADRVKDRDFTAVVTQLITYDRESVPDDPFGSLSGHMERIQALRREYLVKRSMGTVTILTGVAFLTAMISGVAPQIYMLWVQSIGGMPL